MPVDKTDISERMIYAGDFSVEGLIAVGILFALIILVLAWREKRGALGWSFALFVIPRAIAVGVILWILAGPTLETVLKNSRNRSIVVLADTSASMGVADPDDDGGESIRWEAAMGQANPPLVVELDSAASSLAALKTTVHRFTAVCLNARQAGRAGSLIEQARKSLDETVSQLSSVQSALPGDFASRKTELGVVSAALSGLVSTELMRLEEDFQSGRLILAADRSERFARINETLSQLSGQASSVADAWASRLASQATPQDSTGAMQSRTRAEKAGAFLEQSRDTWLRGIRSKVRVAGYRFADTVSPLPTQEWQSSMSTRIGDATQATDITAALEQIARDSTGSSIEAVVMVTDGGHNTNRDPLKVAASLTHLPIYIVPVGNTKPMRDVILHHVQAPRSVFQKDSILIEATVDAQACNGETLTVELLQDKGVVDTQTIRVSSDMYVHRLFFTRKALFLGTQSYDIRIQPLQDERSKDNNDASVAVEVIEDALRVLLVDQKPRWEHRYLRNLFKRDTHIKLEEVLFEPRQADGRSPAVGQGFPADANAWARYRVVILGDVSPSEFTPAQQKLAESFVNERGGSLILIAGDDHMPKDYLIPPFDSLLPVEAAMPLPGEVAAKLRVTAEGNTVPVTQIAPDLAASARLWAEQLPVYNLSPYSQSRPTGHVLIDAVYSQLGRSGQEHTERAFLCWQPYGRGRVVYLSAPITHRLRYRHGDELHHRFWGQLLRWTTAADQSAGSKTVRISTDKTRYQRGDEVNVSVRLYQLNGSAVAGGSVKVHARVGEDKLAEIDLIEEKTVPGSYRAAFRELPAGVVTLNVDGPEVKLLLASEKRQEPVETTIQIDPEAQVELRNTQCNLPLLTRIAEVSGGAVMPPTGLKAALAQLDLSPEVTETVTRRPLWTRWACLWVFLGCLSIEWIARKLTGLA